MANRLKYINILLYIRIATIVALSLFVSGCLPALHQAAATGDTGKIRSLLDSRELDINMPGGPWGLSPLSYAAGNGKFDAARLLLERGANIGIKAEDNSNALVYAAIQGGTEITRYLIEKGADVDVAIDHLRRTKYTCHGCLSSGDAIQLIKELSGRGSPARAASETPKISSQPASVSKQFETISSDIDSAIPNGKPAGKYDVAVVIGNANYSATGTPNVDFAIHDAQVMKEYLVKAFGYASANIIYIENASLAKMYEVFGTSDNYQGKLYKWVKPGQSRVFIYYVGHGAPDQQSGEGYFVPVDANPQYISTNGYKLSTFYENLSKISAIKKTVVIDACFSGSSANGQLLKGVSGLTARLKSEPKATVAADLLLTSAGMDQVASWYPDKGHSLFTYFFLKGIQGDADTNKDGNITMGEMKVWLNDQVPYMARRLTGNEQQPVILGKDGDELVVIRQ